MDEFHVTVRVALFDAKRVSRNLNPQTYLFGPLITTIPSFLDVKRGLHSS